MLRYFLWVVCFYALLNFNILGIGVTPTTFRFSLNKVQTQELSIINSEDEVYRYRVIIQKPEDQKDPNLYMGEWIRYYPKILSVPPKSTRVVRFRVTPPKNTNLEDGEYRAYLTLQEIALKREDRQEVPLEEEGAGESDLYLETLFNYSLSLYGELGEMKPELEFGEIEIIEDEEKNEILWIKGKITNKGNVSQKTVAFITFEDIHGNKSKDHSEVILPISIRENTTQINVQFNKPMENIKKAHIEIRTWTPEIIGDVVIEQRSIEL